MWYNTERRPISVQKDNHPQVKVSDPAICFFSEEEGEQSRVSFLVILHTFLDSIYFALSLILAEPGQH